jgi:hypothetical protein
VPQEQDQSPSVEGAKITIPVVLDLSAAQKQMDDLVASFTRRLGEIGGKADDAGRPVGDANEVRNIPQATADAPMVASDRPRGPTAMEDSPNPPQTLAGMYSSTDRLLLSIAGVLQEILSVLNGIRDRTEADGNG